MNNKLCYIILLALLFVGCESTYKTDRYATIYKEKTATIYPAPVENSAELPDSLLVSYLQQVLPVPFANKGYTVVLTLSGQEIDSMQHYSPKQLYQGDISSYRTLYGLDAVLVTNILGWKETKGKESVFLEFSLRSTHSDEPLLHSWIEASRLIDTTYTGQEIFIPADRRFANQHKTDLRNATRCRLVQVAADYVLRNVPLSEASFYYEKDRFLPSDEEYLRMEIDSEDRVCMYKTSMEEFESHCFL